MQRTGLLVLLLLVAISAYLFQQGHFDQYIQSHHTDIVSSGNVPSQAASLPIENFSSTLPLDSDAHAIILAMIQGVEVPPQENSIAYAIQLDHQKGRPLWNKYKYKEVYAIYKKILAISYYNNSLRGIQIALGVVGDIQKNLGLKQEGLDTLLLAYKIAQLENQPMEYGVVENVIADQLSKDDKGLSLMWRLKAKQHLEGTVYVHDYVSLLNKLAVDLKYFKRDKEARKVFDQAYALSANISSDPNVQWIRKHIQYEYAEELIRIDQCDRALTIIDEHLQQYQSDDDQTVWYFGKMHYLKGQCQIRNGLNPMAYQSFMAAYSAYELQRSLAKGEQDRARIDNANFSIVNALIQFHIDVGNLYEALQLLEENKARTLSDIAGEDFQKTLYQEWRNIQSKQVKEHRALFEKFSQGTGIGLGLDVIPKQFDYVQYMVAYEKLIKKQREEEFQLKLAQESKQTNVSLPEQFHLIRDIGPKIPSDTALVSVFVDKDKVGLFVMTNRGVHYTPTDYTRLKLSLRVREINYMISNPYVDFYKVPTKDIYDNTFKAVINQLDNKIKRLIISKDGYFKNLPIGILYDGTSFLTERFVIQEYPSLRFYNPEKPVKKAEYGISCVDPESYSRLPFQKDTSDFIEKQQGNNFTPLLGTDCTVRKLETAISDHHKDNFFMHMGVHGNYRYGNPLESGMYLTPDEDSTGFWNAKDIGTQNLSQLNLVTLSSRETGLTDQKRFRDVFGINRTLIYAGVKNIVSPVWAVSDYHSSLLMQDFYESYFEQGDPSVALHQAKLNMIKSEQYNHPFFWGGFVSTGGLH